MWKRQCSSLVSSARTSLFATPALLTRISTPRPRDRALPPGPQRPAELVTSSVSPIASMPEFLEIAATALSTRSGIMSATTTARPGLAERLRAGEARFPARRR